MAQTFNKKSIRVTITTQKGETFVLEDFAIDCSIQKNGGVELSKSKVNIYGLKLETMQRLVWTQYRNRTLAYNRITVEAKEGNSAYSMVFKGEILFCVADFNGASPVLKIEATTAALGKLIPDDPISVEGSQSAASLIESLAKKANLTFTNEGVTAQVSDTTLSGDPVTKMQSIARQVGAELLIEDQHVTLLPKNKPKETVGGGSPVVDAESGMIGYPTLTNTGVNCTCYYRPDIRLGSSVTVKTIVPMASGTWLVTQVSHELSANNPKKSAWKTSFTGTWWV
jgi:hypothetical protein